VPRFWPVIVANSLIAVVGDVFGPAVAALTLGLFSRKQLARRMGRNSAFLSGLAAGVIVDHFGYDPAFLTLGAAAVVALVVFAFGMPETADREQAPRKASV
jgi:predicted MFS family arabinose efflux permease